MGSPLISVVIPAYNHELYVGAAVESVLQQTCTDLELIVVDDGSTDNTADVVRSYTDQRLRYFFQENRDAFNTINRGIELAEGRFVSILNSDDVYSTDRLERLVAECERRSLVCAFSDVIPISDNDETFSDPAFGWNVWHQKNRDFFFECKDLYTAFLKGNFMVTTSNLFMTADAARQVGQFCPLRYLHDYDFVFRMITAFPDQVYYASDLKLLYYRIHGGNTLGEAAIIGREQDQELIKKYLLAVIPEELKKYVDAGSDRLVELERELSAVRRQVNSTEPEGVRPALKNLKEVCRCWIKKKLSSGSEQNNCL